MKDMLEKLAGGHEDDHDDKAQAKMDVLHELRQMAMEMMGEKVRGKMPHEMHGVEVMAPDQEGLEKGLDMAKHSLPDEEQDEESIHPGIHKEVARMEGDQGPQMSGHGQPDDSHAMEADSDDDMYSDMDHDELDQHIAQLQKLKQAKMRR